MANNKPELIDALRQTANKLSSGATYEWGHMGRCNCGHLVQTLLDITEQEIVESVDFQLDEWSEHATDYCEGTGAKVDDLFTQLYHAGLGYQDVIQLENLSNRAVLQRISTESGTERPVHLKRNSVEDVTLYMHAMADMLQEDA